MPCHDERNDPSYIHEEYRDQIEKMQKKLDLVTRIACYGMRRLKETGEKIPPFAKEWYKAHKTFDEKEGR